MAEVFSGSAAGIADQPERLNDLGPDGSSGAPEATDQAMSRLVRIFAARILAGLPPGSGIEMSDLIQAGNLGFLQATRTFSPEIGAPLAGYAKFRIRGEMLDTVRRSSRRRRAEVDIRGAAVEDYADLEGLLPASPDSSPHTLVARSQRAAILGEEVARLPPRHRAVVRLRYSGNFSLREIGAMLSVHESRACQLHRSALGRLRRALGRRGLRGMATLI